MAQTIAVNIGANTDEFTAGLKEILSGLRAFAREVNAITSQANANLRAIDASIKQAARNMAGDLRKVSVDARDTAEAIQSIKPPAGGDSIFSGLLGGIAKATLAAQGLVAVLGQVRDAAVAVVAPGFQFETMMESGRLGMAGTLVSMGRLNGEAIEFNDALKIADTLMKELNQDAINTAATTQDLLTVFQGLLAPGLGKGFTLEQIREYTKVGVNAVKSMNLPSNQFLQELRAPLTGGIRPAADQLAAALGIDDAAVKEAEQSAEGLFAFLMRKMEGFRYSAAAFPDTILGAISQVQEYATLASAKFTEAFKPEIRVLMEWLQNQFGTLGQDGFKVSPQILDAIAAIKAGLDGLIGKARQVMQVFGSFDVDGRWYPSEQTVELFSQAAGFANDVATALLRAAPICAAIADEVLAWYRAFMKIINTVERALLPDIETAKGEFSNVETAIRRIVDAMMGMYVIEKITGLVQSLGVAVQAVKVGYDAIRKAIHGATLSQMAFNAAQAIGALAKHPALLAAGAISVGAIGGAYAAGAFDDQIAALKAKLKAFFGEAGDLYAEWLNQFAPNSNTGTGGSPDAGSVTGIETDMKSEEIIKASQAALRQQVAALKTAFDSQVKAFRDALEDVTVAFKQNLVGWQEMSLAEAEFDVHKEQAAIDSLEKQLAVTEAAEYRGADERNAAIQRVNTELDKHRQELVRAEMALEDVRRVISGITQRGGANGSVLNTSKMGQVANDAFQAGIDAFVGVTMDNGRVGCVEAATKIGAYFSDFFAGALEEGIVNVTALEEAAKQAKIRIEEFNGENRIDAGDVVVFGANSPDDEDFPGEGQHVVLSKGGRAFVDNSSSANGGAGGVIEGEDIFDIGLPVARIIKTSETIRQNLESAAGGLGDVVATTAAGAKAIERFNSGEKEALAVEKDYFAIFGDISTIPAQILEKTYKDLIQKLNAGGFHEAAAHAEAVLRDKLNGLKANQIFSDIDAALSNVRTAAEDMSLRIAAGVADAAASVEAVAAEYADGIGEEVKKLFARLGDAINTKNTEQQREIMEKVRAVHSTLANVFESFANAVNELASWRKSMVEANPELSDLQRKRALGNVERLHHLELAKTQRAAAAAFYQSGDMERGMAAERQAELNERLADTVDAMNDVRQASKQAIEDGLVSFLTDGINQAKNLADALREMTIGILKTLQRFFAERIALDFMDALFPAKDKGERLAFATGGAAGHAQGGLIRGAGTGTSDSIPALLSNGEYVIRAAAVKRYGANLLERINNGTFGNIRVNVPAFSGGGLVGDMNEGLMHRFAAFVSAAPVNISTYVDGQKVFDRYGKELVRQEVRRTNLKDAKRNMEIMRRLT